MQKTSKNIENRARKVWARLWEQYAGILGSAASISICCAVAAQPSQGADRLFQPPGVSGRGTLQMLPSGLVVLPAGDKGKGLFTAAPIEKGDVVLSLAALLPDGSDRAVVGQFLPQLG